MSQPDTLTEKYVLAVTLPIAALSFFGSAALICTFLSFRDSVQSQSRRLIFFLSVADLGQSIFFLLPGFAGSRFVCVVLSMFGIISALASFLWTVIISHFVWKTVHNPTEIQSNYSSNYHLIGWGYPVLTILILLISAPTWEPYNSSKFDVFGPDSSVGWCFIPKEYPLQRLLTIYAPLATCWFLTAFFYLSARNQVRAMTNDTITTPLAAQRHEAMQEVMQKLALIPAGFIALRMWGALYRMFYVFRDQDSPNAEQNFVHEFRWLGVLTALGDPAQGFFNFCVFIGMNRKMWLRFRALVRHSCCGADPVDADDPIHELRNGPGLRAACLDCCTCGRYRATGAAYYRGSGDSNGSGNSGRASFAFGSNGPSFGSNGESPGPHITSTYGSNNSSSGETFHFTDAGHMIPDEPLPANTSLLQQPNRNLNVGASGSQSSGSVMNVVDVGGLPIAISPRPLAKDASGSWLDGKLRLSAHPVADVYRAP